MEENTHSVEPHTVRAAAYLLGRLNARGGDSYDVLESFAVGWAHQLDAWADSEPPAAYTTPGQAGGEPDVAVGASPAVDQGPPASVSKEQLRLQLAILASLRAAVESVIEWRVQDAREQRWSWAEIAEPLETTRQGAHQRYGAMTHEDAVAERYEK